MAPAPAKPPESGAAPNAPPVDPNHFYSAPELSRPPRPLGEVNLDIPEAGLLTGPGTLMILTLWIDAQGRVISFKVDGPDLPGEYTAAVAETFSAVRFAPGEIMGHKVGSVLKVEIRHEPSAAPGP